MAYHNPSLYEMKPTPLGFIEELVNFKYLVHGHACPICKSTMLDLQSIVQAWKIPHTASNQQDYGLKRMSCKENYVLVCSEHCAYLVRKFYDHPVERLAILNKLELYVGKGNGLVKKIKRENRDTYRDIVLKNCGIIPSSTQYKVYQTIAQAVADFTSGKMFPREVV